MPVQEQVLTHAFGGQDLYVQSQTGTGKTAAFLVVIFQRLLTEPLLNGKKAIIMVPTRELAVQVEEEAKLLGKYLPFKIGSFYGGVGYADQQRILRDNAQILVGTPGRVLDLNGSGLMNLMDIAFLVLDEADRMFDMGFYPDLRKLIKVVPPADRRQTMLFSATLNNWVKNLAWEYTKSPHEIEIAPENVTVEEIEQVLYHVPSDDKMRLLLGILEREKPESAIIFCNTKRYAEIAAKRLRLNGIECEFIMGDLPQSKRLKIIDEVKAGRTRFLVATDVAARGLDIESLALVVNYDLPIEAENYVHRIGRTARAGKTGKAITLASEQDVYELPAIERYIGKKIPSENAGEELYAQDKSEGMYIQTEFFGGRDSRARPGGRDDRQGRRERPDSRERTGQAGRRPLGGRREERSRRDRDEGRPASGRKSAEPRRTRFEGNAAPGQDLSHLTFEERMAYYRKKYDTGGADRAAACADTASEGKGEQKRNRRRGGKGKGCGPERGGTPEAQAASAPPLGTGGEPEKARSRKPPERREQEAPRTPKPADAPKQGILSRLLGIFKKK
jgi:ATP-dependent RNA helicase RhlB